MRITAACPQGLIGDANSLAMIWGQCPDDAQTFRQLKWVDGTGHAYAVASWEAIEDWHAFATASATASALELLRPQWDSGAMIDMQAATRAQAALTFWEPTDPQTPPPPADPGKLVLIAGLDGAEALAGLGLSRKSAP